MGDCYFNYGDEETEYLRSRDKKLGEVIDSVGHIYRECFDDLFEAVVNSIVGQQISTAAHRSIWKRIKDDNEKITPDVIIGMGRECIQSYGISERKADYINEFAQKVRDGSFDIDAVRLMSDDEAAAALSSLRGVGVWTAHMILLFCLRRPDIFSYEDLGIRRGIMMVYHHKALPRERFERYRKRFSPYGSVASLYFWAVSGGAVPSISDPTEKK
jgi:DNA-3-methyladenine glycosylase II